MATTTATLSTAEMSVHIITVVTITTVLILFAIVSVFITCQQRSRDRSLRRERVTLQADMAKANSMSETAVLINKLSPAAVTSYPQLTLNSSATDGRTTLNKRIDSAGCPLRNGPMRAIASHPDSNPRLPPTDTLIGLPPPDYKMALDADSSPNLSIHRELLTEATIEMIPQTGRHHLTDSIGPCPEQTALLLVAEDGKEMPYPAVTPNHDYGRINGRTAFRKINNNNYNSDNYDATRHQFSIDEDIQQVSDTIKRRGGRAKSQSVSPPKNTKALKEHETAMTTVTKPMNGKLRTSPSKDVHAYFSDGVSMPTVAHESANHHQKQQQQQMAAARDTLRQLSKTKIGQRCANHNLMQSAAGSSNRDNDKVGTDLITLDRPINSNGRNKLPPHALLRQAQSVESMRSEASEIWKPLSNGTAVTSHSPLMAGTLPLKPALTASVRYSPSVQPSRPHVTINVTPNACYNHSTNNTQSAIPFSHLTQSKRSVSLEVDV